MIINYRAKITFFIFLFIFISGCARIQESWRVFWGSSTRALQEARTEAVSKSYICEYDACFNEVIKILEEYGSRIFIKDKDRHMIVAIEIRDCISTTEVGIFFIEEGIDKVRVEISSLSPKAKRIASEIIFSALDNLYKS